MVAFPRAPRNMGMTDSQCEPLTQGLGVKKKAVGMQICLWGGEVTAKLNLVNLDVAVDTHQSAETSRAWSEWSTCHYPHDHPRLSIPSLFKKSGEHKDAHVALQSTSLLILPFILSHSQFCHWNPHPKPGLSTPGCRRWVCSIFRHCALL
jgi:hypothetical protein